MATKKPLEEPPEFRKLNGDDRFSGGPHDIRVSKFWEWGFSDVRLNIVRGILAEFLVREAVGDTRPKRIAWDNFDVLMLSPSHPDGIRIEVKSSGYWQSWPQSDKSRIGFSGLSAVGAAEKLTT